MDRRKTLRFDPDGAQRFEGAMTAAERGMVEAALAHLPADRPGIRLPVGSLTSLQAANAIAVGVLGAQAMPVRAVLFDKTASANWNLAWHQDRTIVVREKVDAIGYGPWSVKGGLQHVEPPFEVLARMITLRIHLDPVDEDNAPLLVAPGSHRLGRAPIDKVDARVESLGAVSCLADAGDIWLYATPILHASAPANRPRRRRVLQIDYAADLLPGGLTWLGV